KAIAATSEDGKYIFSQRNLFYRVRPFVEQETGQALGWSNFTSILTDYEAEHGNIAGLIRDDRGSFHDLEASIGLGTTAVSNYQRPDWQFHKLLFCEKEDHVRILQQAGWPERHDCAVMSSKGYASRAARDVIDAIADTAEHEPVTVFCIHDADAAGTMIAQSLQEATRARGRRRVDIIDIGLQPWDAIEMGLPLEDVSHGKPQPVAAYVLGRDDGNRWRIWLQHHRVELNAMTPGELVRWLDENVEKHGDLKVVPPADIAISALRDGIRDAILDRERERILRAAEPKIRKAAAAAIAAVQVPSSHDLIANIRRAVQEQRNRHWTDIVTDAVRAAIAGGKP
ncbi:MAG: hypothetical protein ABSC06_32505, partial [Rhodopila sp.]